MTALRRHLKPLDIVIIFLALAVVARSVYTLIANPLQPELLRIQADEREFLYPMSEELVLLPLDEKGTCVIELRNGEARVVSSECPRRICISQGVIDRPGGWIACLPHQIFIEVLGTGDGYAVDAIAQ